MIYSSVVGDVTVTGGTPGSRSSIVIMDDLGQRYEARSTKLLGNFLSCGMIRRITEDTQCESSRLLAR